MNSRGGRWALVVALMLPGVAAAQTPADGPRLSLAGGAGLARPFHGDFDFTAWAWDADVRVALSRPVTLEASVGEWRHEESRTGIPTILGSVSQSTRRVQRAIHISLLAGGTIGPVRLFGGGGIGLLRHERRFRQTISDCPAPSDAFCGSTETTTSDISGSVQGSAGADVSFAPAFALYGLARLTVPARDPGGSELRLIAGLRWHPF